MSSVTIFDILLFTVYNNFNYIVFSLSLMNISHLHHHYTVTTTVSGTVINGI